MNRLKKEKQEMVLNLLVEGNSIRSIERITGVHRDTIMRLMVRVGQKCREIMAEKLRGIKCGNVEVDEIWCYVGCKQKNVNGSHNPEEFGDQYVFVALDSDTKLVPAFTIGKRDSLHAYLTFLQLSVRTKGRFQLTTDQFEGYRSVSTVLGDRVDYAMLRKVYHGDNDRKYSPSRLCGTRKRRVSGNPDPKRICTSYVERQNLTIRMQLRRFTRLTNAFSKELENLKAALSVYFWHYNFCRIHSSLRITPAMEARVTNKIWNWTPVLES